MNLLYRFIYTLLLFLTMLFQNYLIEVPPETITYTGSESYMPSSFYKALTSVEKQDVRTNIVNIARSQLGYMEGSSKKYLDGTAMSNKNYTEYGYWYGMQDAWCAMFVSWCADLAGETNVPKHASCTTGLKVFQQKGLAHSRESIINGDYVPQPGDVIYFADPTVLKPGKISTHVGIVTKYNNGMIYTIEGNASSNDKTIATGGMVEEKYYSINNTYIIFVCELV